VFEILGVEPPRDIPDAVLDRTSKVGFGKLTLTLCSSCP